MINIQGDSFFINDLETNCKEKNEPERDPDIERIIDIIDRPIKRIKGAFKKEIKQIIDIKVNMLQKSKKI